jgi:glycosyltransferase involved in cell wall biosynthesis
VNTPTVSVIIPTWNLGKYIAKSIDSVLAQTYPAHEILIIDDGSTDDTRAVVAAQSDPRIRYIPIPHCGTAAARNKGIDLASGDYLAFLDADDLWRPTMLEKQVAVMEHDKGLICSFTNFVRFVESTGEVYPDQFQYYPELATLPVTACGCGDARIVQGDAFVHLIAFGEIPAYMQCMLFRTSMVGKLRLLDHLVRCQDLEFAARVFMHGKVAFTPEVLTDVRRHDSNITKDISLMALDKLWALQPLRAAVDTPARRAALNDRLVKAWIDAATALIQAGRRRDGLKHYAKALTQPGPGVRKLKGTARVGYELVTSITR